MPISQRDGSQHDSGGGKPIQSVCQSNPLFHRKGVAWETSAQMLRLWTVGVASYPPLCREFFSGRKMPHQPHPPPAAVRTRLLRSSPLYWTYRVWCFWRADTLIFSETMCSSTRWALARASLCYACMLLAVSRRRRVRLESRGRKYGSGRTSRRPSPLSAVGRP